MGCKANKTLIYSRCLEDDFTAGGDSVAAAMAAVESSKTTALAGGVSVAVSTDIFWGRSGRLLTLSSPPVGALPGAACPKNHTFHNNPLSKGLNCETIIYSRCLEDDL